MNTPLTDEQVRDLPLDLVRARLREDILATPAAHHPRRRTTAWTAGLAAAASVAALAVVPRLIGGHDEQPTVSPTAPAASPTRRASAPAEPARLDHPLAALTSVSEGWTLDDADLGGGPGYGLTYLRRVEVPSGEPSADLFSLEWRRASWRAQEVAEQTTQGGVRVGTIDVDGREAPAWRLDTDPDGAPSCSPPDCAHSWIAVLPAEDGWFLTVIGAGISAAALTEDEWRDLVSRVRVWPSGGAPADLREALTTIGELPRSATDGARIAP